MGQKFIAREPYEFSNGATGWRPGGPFDCLGPFAKVTNCPIEGTTLRRTVYATGYADTFFSVPACTKVGGQHVGGYLTQEGDAVRFVPYDRFVDRLPRPSADDVERLVRERLAIEGYALHYMPIPSSDPREDMAWVRVTIETLGQFPGLVEKLARDWRIVRHSSADATV